MCHDVVSKIKLVKPEKVLGIENALIGAAQQGKLRNKLSEAELVAMLENQTKSESKIIVPMPPFSSNAEASMTSGDMIGHTYLPIIIMYSKRKSFKDNVYKAIPKIRHKSIYNGDHSHTLSMNLLIESGASPDKLAYFGDGSLQHKLSCKEGVRESVRDRGEVSGGKRSYREDLYSRSKKKLLTASTMYSECPSTAQLRPKPYLERERVWVERDELEVMLQSIRKL